MDDFDLNLLADKIADRLREEGPCPQGPDFTTNELVKLMGINPATASSVTTGRYNIGRAVRFRREVILYHRKMGIPLATTPKGARRVNVP